MTSKKTQNLFNNFRIGRIKLTNFKSFADTLELNFGEHQLIILDGPNGFGKTTIFDAIEISITGRLLRVRDGDGKVKDKHLLINNLLSDAEIYLELLDSRGAGNLIIHSNICNYKGVARDYDKKIVRKILNHWPFDDIANEIFTTPLDISKLQDMLSYPAIDSMFTVLNYIQQEEALHYLRDDEKKRYQKIQHLIGKAADVEDYTRLKKFLEKFKNDISSEQAVFDEFNAKLISIEAASTELSEDDQQGEIVTLSGSTIPALSTDDDISQLDKWLDALNKCRIIFEGGDAYNKILLKHEVSKWQKPQYKKRLINVLNFSNHSAPEKTAIKLNNHIISIEKIITKNKSYRLISTEYNNRSSTTMMLDEIKKVFLSQYQLHADLIGLWYGAKNTVDVMGSMINTVIASREKLYNDFHAHWIKEHTEAQAAVECPLCGSLFEEFSLLSEACEKHHRELISLQDTASSALTEAEDNLWEKMISPLVRRSLKLNNLCQRIDRNYAQRLVSRRVSQDEVALISSDRKWFSEYYPSYTQYVSPDVISADYNDEESHNHLVKAMLNYDNELRFNVDGNYDEILSAATTARLKSNEAGQWMGSLADIDNDIKCINNVLSLKKNNNYLTAKASVDGSHAKLEKLQKIKVKLESAVKIYKKVIEADDKFMSKAVRIPFYIYSSKILQTRFTSNQPSSGIVLRSAEGDRENGFYRFCAELNDKHDAWNTMSSGQLAGVVIAFMLTMNKVYPSGLKTLLIDDPVQAMDDINMASFVHLMRGEFSSHQVILSTHDSKVANYLAFKYQTSKLNAQHINLKKIRRASLDPAS